MQAYAVDVYNTLHLDELYQLIPNPTQWIYPLAALLALICCFFGYKTRNLWFVGVCLLFGLMVGWLFHSRDILNMHFSIAVAMVAAIAFIFTYALSSAELVFCLSFYFLFSVFKLDLWVAIVPSAVLAAGSIFLSRWIASLVTSAAGAYFFVKYLAILELPFLGRPDVLRTIGDAIAPGTVGFAVSLAVLAVLGFLVQGVHNSLFGHGD